MEARSDKLELKIKVVPNAKHNFLKEESSLFKVYLTAPAIDGKANLALIKFLADHFKVRKNRIKILRGEKSRQKLIEIKEEEKQ